MQTFSEFHFYYILYTNKEALSAYINPPVMTLADLQSSSSSSPVINLGNAVVRLLQAILAAAVIGLYASEYHVLDDSAYYSTRHIFYLAVAVGSLSLLTALVYIVLPFILSYRVVAFACPWDWILFFVWTATFAEMKKYFPWGKIYADFAAQHADDYPDFRKMQDAVWVDLASMLLWLVTALAGVVMIFLSRTGGRKTASYV